MKVLMIDDTKSPTIFKDLSGVRFKVEDVVLAKNYSDGLTSLLDQGPWDLLLIDWNLSEFSPSRNGYTILRHLRRYESKVKHVIVITSDETKAKEMVATCQELKAAKLINSFSVQNP